MARDSGKESDVIEVSLRYLFISTAHNFFDHHGKEPGRSPNKEVPEIECLAGRGIRGGRFLDYREDCKGQSRSSVLKCFKGSAQSSELTH